MGRTQRVLAVLLLHIALAHTFSWDIVVARSNKLEFYNEGTLAYAVLPSYHRIKWIIYDPLLDRVLFSDIRNKNSAYYLDMATKTTQSLIIMKKTNRYYKRFAYDPATELLFGTLVNKIYSFPIKSGNKNEVNATLVVDLGSSVPRELAVDSCGGYIYWTASNTIERALFNGSDREVIIEKNITVKQGLTIDTQKMYWIESQEYNEGGFTIESADLNGKNRITLYNETESDSLPDKLIVSKYFVSWRYGIETTFVWQLPKNPTNDTNVKPNKILITSTSRCPSYGFQDLAANYKIEERTQGVPNCYVLKSLLPDAADRLFCVHGTKVRGEFRCECTQGYIGERCDVSVCYNYCDQGACDVAAGGQPKCRCNAGYSGETCEVNACHDHCYNKGVCSFNEEDEPFCQCTAGYEGERCEVSVCEDYCWQGNCSVSAEGQPRCSCDAGYSGERCDVSPCHNYCLNNGTCSLNNHSEPICQCTGQYKGERCEVSPVVMEPVYPKTYHGKYHWLSIVNDKLPANAIAGGFERGYVYIARAYHGTGALCPGKYVPSLDKGYISWKGEEYDQSKKEIEILCGNRTKWVTTDLSNVPKNAFIAGHTGGHDDIFGEPLYVCRGMIGNDLVLGKANARLNKCYLPYHGEREVTTSYEILVEPDDET